MHRYNKNMRWFLASCFNGSGSTYGSKPFLALGYNASVDVLDTPDFDKFDYTDAIFIDMEKIKIVRNTIGSESADFTQGERKYKYVTNNNFDEFDDVINGITEDDDVFYYLYLEKTISIAESVTSFPTINMLSLILVHKYQDLPYSYDIFRASNLDGVPRTLDSDYTIVKLSLDYVTTIDTSVSTNNYLKFRVII